MPAAARLLLALLSLSSGGYALFVSPSLSGGGEPLAAAAPAAPATPAPDAARSPAQPPANQSAPAAAAPAAAPDALLEESNGAFAAERWQEALEPTRLLVLRFPGHHVYLKRLAEIYRKLGRPADEAATWEVFLDRAPLPAEACPFIGHAYRQLGEYDRAIAAFERCFAADPQNAELAFFVALGNEWATRFEPAQTWYEKAIRLAPPQYDSEVGLARVLLHRNRLDQALGRARAVLRHVPKHVDAALVAGLAAQRAGNRVEARVHLETAVSVAEDYFDVQLALGVLDYSESKYLDARGRFETAARLDPSRRDEVQPWLDRTANVKAAP